MDTTLIKPGEVDEVNGDKYDENIEITLPKPKAIIKRVLRGSGYRWEMRGNTLAVMDTKNNVEVVLTKVGAMSLMKFLPNYLDKMRIEQGKEERAKMKRLREREKARREKLQERISKAKEKKQQVKNQLSLLQAKARKVKHESDTE